MTALRYLSVCSGIEAATVAWHPLGFVPVGFAEIDKFPSAVLAHHYPHVPNFGDLTRFHEWPSATFDVLVGGTPCQSFSVAGLRAGLADPRGNLMLTYLGIADRYRPRWLLWENVPGVLSSNRGRDFGTFLGALGQLGYGFAYRVLDAQYVRIDGFGRAVPQRRRRVFVVGHLGDWRRAAAVLFDAASLHGDSAPRRETGKRAAPTIAARTRGGGGLGTDFDCDCGLIAAPAVARCVATREGSSQDYETTTMVAHALRADGFDASEDGTGRGTPLVPVGLTLHGTDGTQSIASLTDVSSSLCARIPSGVENSTTTAVLQPIAFDARQSDVCVYGNITAPLDTDGTSQAIAFSCKDHGADAADGIAPTLRAMGFADSHANAGGQLAVAFAENSRAELRLENGDGAVTGALKVGGGKPGQSYPAVAYDMRGREGGAQFEGPHETANIRAASGGSSRSYVAQTWAVRRLTPAECEALQGFPRDYTLVPYRGRPAADGPRYKALGNSMAINCMRWIGKRIAMVEETTP